MKKIIVIAGAAVALAQTPAHAADNEHLARNVGLGSGFVIGAIAGGPVGAVLGAALGGQFGHKHERAARVPGLQDELRTAQGELQTSQSRLAALDVQLQRSRADLAAMGAELGELLVQRNVIDGLQMDLMYPTGQSEISPAARERLGKLARLLGKMPEINVRLDGYADPRGSEAYNLKLSSERAIAVRDALIAAGVDAQRISAYAHGEAGATATEGDTDAYAFERRVLIRLQVTGDPAATVALAPDQQQPTVEQN